MATVPPGLVTRTISRSMAAGSSAWWRTMLANSASTEPSSGRRHGVRGGAPGHGARGPDVRGIGGQGKERLGPFGAAHPHRGGFGGGGKVSVAAVVVGPLAPDKRDKNISVSTS